MKNKNRKFAAIGLTIASLGRRLQAYIEQPQTRESAKAATGFLVAVLSYSILPGKIIIPMFLAGVLILANGMFRIFKGAKEAFDETKGNYPGNRK